MNDKKEKIIEYLKIKYNPDIIFLHGSRAIGFERDNSDWDFILVCDHKCKYADLRESFLNENIEVVFKYFPIENVLKSFGNKLQNAEVVFDKKGKGELILSEIKSIYEKGFIWPINWPEEPKLWLEGRLFGMKDNINNPEIFLKYFSEFYTRSLNYWYMVKNKKYSRPIYLALDEIKGKDPEFRKLLNDISKEDIKNNDRIIIAEKMVSNLFNKYENNNI